MAGRLVESTDVEANDAVLDVGCGTGNVAITAARRGADVAALDVTPAMLEAAQENATVAAVDIAFREGTATDLPYAADAFDVTVSALGHIYGDPPEATARELIRLTRPGGRIGFTSWTPTSLYPILARLLVSSLPPNPRAEFSEPPFMWGDPDVVETDWDPTPTRSPWRPKRSRTLRSRRNTSGRSRSKAPPCSRGSSTTCPTGRRSSRNWSTRSPRISTRNGTSWNWSTFSRARRSPDPIHEDGLSSDRPRSRYLTEHVSRECPGHDHR